MLEEQKSMNSKDQNNLLTSRWTQQTGQLIEKISSEPIFKKIIFIPGSGAEPQPPPKAVNWKGMTDRLKIAVGNQHLHHAADLIGSGIKL